MKRPAHSDTTQLLERQSRALKRHLPGAIKGDDRAVHQARVASRRLRESVPVLSEGLKPKNANKARRKIRRLTGALGMVRELDVALQLLDELATGGDVPRSAIDELRAHVLAERQSRRGVMLKRLERVNTEKLGRRLAALAIALTESGGTQWRRVLGKRLLRRAKRLRAAVEETGHLYVPDRLHEVRIAAKKLRYGLELAADSGVKAAAPLVRALKKVQEQLGRLQDLQVLRSHLAMVQAAPSSHRAPHHALEALALRLDEESRRLHGRYVAAAQTILDVTGEVRKSVIPHLAHPPRRTAPLKMPLARPRARASAAGRR